MRRRGARADDLGAALARLEADGHARVWVEGGGLLVRAMLALGKLDVLELAVIPVVLGAGIPLVPQGTPETWLSRASARPWRRGALHLVYRRAA